MVNKSYVRLYKLFTKYLIINKFSYYIGNTKVLFIFHIDQGRS